MIAIWRAINAVLAAIPPLVYAAVIALLLAGFAWRGVVLTDLRRQHAQTLADVAAKTAAAEAAARRAVEAVRARETEIAHDQEARAAIERQAATERAAAERSLGADIGRLRHAARAAPGACPASAPAAAGRHQPPASAPADLRAELLGRLAEAGARVAGYADAATAAVAACVADYEGVRQ